MTRKRAIGWGVGGLALVVVVAGLLVFEPWLLFVDNEVDEELPGGATDFATAADGLDDTGGQGPGGGETDDGEGGPQLVQLDTGDFIDAEHGTSGVVRILRDGDGNRFLRLDGFETSNGPDLHVWITDQPSGGTCDGCSDSWGIYDDGDYLRLGGLKANIGNQNYEIPDGADLSGMRSVVIWCDRFNVAFGTAAIG